jgi:transcriptional regulator GlxA family with amidase domain
MHQGSLVLQVLAAASEFAGLVEVNDISAALRESLLVAIDAAFADVVAAQWASHANSSRLFKVFRDLELELTAHIGEPVYSGELARNIGVSVRTMHDAVQRYRGMSLHRYLRLRRLWLVRQQLVVGTHSVKSAALAFGFWHLGDFSHSYLLQFGESPSDTLAKSRLS